MLELMDEQIIDECKQYLTTFEKSNSHGIGHVQKVLDFALELSKDKMVNRRVVIVASLLHDVSRHHGFSGENHGAESANLINDFLDILGLRYDEVNLVKSVITNHSLYVQNSNVSLESKIVYDADKLSGFGFIGFIRICMYAGERGKDMGYVKRKLLESMPARVKNLHLMHSKEIANSLNKEVQPFIDMLG